MPGNCQERTNVNQPSVSSQAEGKHRDLEIIQKLGFRFLLCDFKQKAYPL